MESLTKKEKILLGVSIGISVGAIMIGVKNRELIKDVNANLEVLRNDLYHNGKILSDVIENELTRD